MNYYDERLQELQAKIAAKNRLEAKLKELRSQYAELAEKVEELENRKLAEDADVERLEGRSLANFFYNVVGKMDDKLTKERQEAYEATVKFDAAYKELEAVEKDIRYHESEYGKVSRSEEEYKSSLQEKKEAIKSAGHPKAAEILTMEERISYLKSQEEELDEAISAGKSAESMAERILSSLSSAESWGTFDLLGGGIIADAVKHSHLDEAQTQVEQLQAALRRFKTELADVNVNADMQVNIDGFLRFADYFFDGLFADWAVLDRISQSQGKVQKVKSQIGCVLDKLNAMKSTVKAEQNSTETKLRELIKSVAV